jgi:serine phosphatase RsbU (regulator of sigma subunit)
MSIPPLPRLTYLGSNPPLLPVEAFSKVGLALDLRTGERIEAQELLKNQLLLLEVNSATVRNLGGLCRRWRIELGEPFLPIVWLHRDLSSTEILEGYDAGADAVISVTQPLEVTLAQLKSLLRIQFHSQRLSVRAAEAGQLHQRLQQAYQQMDQDLELTRRIHRGFLPQVKPRIGSLNFAVNYRPRSRIGGDFYDILRLDEHHVGIYLADAMGTGLPASSLLSIFVKRSLQPKEIRGNSYRLLPPDEILSQLNRELVGLQLAEPPFVTLVWVQIDSRDGLLHFARAAHPHPLYVPREGAIEYWHAPGTLLGVFEADFPTQKVQLQPGDKLLLFSDGVHSPSANLLEDPLVLASREYRDFPLDTFVENVSNSILKRTRSQEDFTVLGIEYQP